MGQKRVSFKVAKAIKEAGYLQDKSNNNQYYTKDGQLSDLYYYGVPYNDVDCFAPTYFDVWLWLWERGIHIEILSTFAFIRNYNVATQEYSNPEGGIIEAIEYLVDNYLIK